MCLSFVASEAAIHVLSVSDSCCQALWVNAIVELCERIVLFHVLDVVWICSIYNRPSLLQTSSACHRALYMDIIVMLSVIKAFPDERNLPAAPQFTQTKLVTDTSEMMNSLVRAHNRFRVSYVDACTVEWIYKCHSDCECIIDEMLLENGCFR